MQLVTIPFSHFCEKGRWALDRSGAQYRELQFVPVLHRLAVMPLGSVTSPVLIDAPRIVPGSNEIIRHADARGRDQDRLFPPDRAQSAEVEALVARFDETVAPQVRLWLYSWANEDPQRLYDFCIGSIPRAQRPLMRASLPLISKALVMHFELDSETHAKAAELVTQEFEFVSELLADGREYLVGDRFTAADLAFAAFVGSVVDAPNYGGTRFTPPPHPEALAEQAAAWRSTSAAEWVRRIYARHRVASPRIAQPATA